MEDDDYKKKLDEQWYTCKHCGIKKDEEKYNYVIMGECRKCKDKKERDYDFKKATEEGRVTRDNSIMCPYCGEIVEDDWYEYMRDSTYTCGECNKKSDMSVESTYHFTTSKREE